ncbi:GCN5-related N-acetyltransferase [Shewanella baltica OS625]|uniref:GCN5-related N-acetyltransferase n=1 Tax=Shewanella baltica (strain OS195) TaxID=399599 RepID=A9KW75_SHEB9|nr:N-acetyltransferase [Shewanella baltica]ABX47355.1 GCN5-related N-acetyltransferase [Shewanella baltica OS195]ADT92379.1 GCN5-related N-acetyltransferase [Shewanella baltica OS678]EHC03955.1 GCN5-related N-acetyltransferase [Shewanella baltica OS625]
MQSIRPVLKSDLFAVYQLEQAIFGEHSYPDFFFRQGFDCWPEQFLVAVDEDNLLQGYLLSAQSGDPTCRWILSVAVSEDARGKGLGKHLMQQCLAELPAAVERVCLTVDPSNPAHGLYQHLGFVDSAFEVDYFGAGADRVVMTYRKS